MNRISKLEYKDSLMAQANHLRGMMSVLISPEFFCLSVPDEAKTGETHTLMSIQVARLESEASKVFAMTDSEFNEYTKYHSTQEKS